MNFRTLLLASAAVMFTSSAFAADITNPFFLPTKGKVLSNTSIETSRLKGDNGTREEIQKSLSASEEISVGVMDNLAIVGRISNAFDYDKSDEGSNYNNDHNFDYAIGAKYNMTHGKWMSQIGVGYETYDPRSWYGHDNDNDSWEKAISAQVKLGYAYDCGLTPYTSLGVTSDIDEGNREQAYRWFLGAHKTWDNFSADAGVRYDWDWTEDLEGNGDEHMEVWNLDVAGNYFVSENFTVGAYGSYYLGGTYHNDVEYNYTFGLNAKVLF